MANTVSISYTCGCQFAHNTNGGAAQNNLDYKMCSTHSVKTNAQRPEMLRLGKLIIDHLQEFRVLTGN